MRWRPGSLTPIPQFDSNPQTTPERQQRQRPELGGVPDLAGSGGEGAQCATRRVVQSRCHTEEVELGRFVRKCEKTEHLLRDCINIQFDFFRSCSLLIHLIQLAWCRQPGWRKEPRRRRPSALAAASPLNFSVFLSPPWNISLCRRSAVDFFRPRFAWHISLHVSTSDLLSSFTLCVLL
ncbi:hypothetical protein SORBI_3002G416250 [Sorghum bicolor]|uniref:Uncharacterized protein n=1 Tax=Sorghum bicolor TaxID=4558 RepID=A0A1B6QG95_SORBI|nr:hypothetical protein SORBI_3002G416250 [Sorghum bicolor]